jgi:hypothetical protein
MRNRVLPPCQPASIIVLLSLVFGSIIIVANPPLRGPDEIAHFLRIYSYARGEVLPVTEINGRKGIVVSPELYNQVYFFKTAGEVIARSREQGMRYGQIMAEYSKLAGTDEHQSDQASLFAPFAGTEGYNPAAYIPYIVGQLLGGMIWGISSAWHEATEIDARNARYVNDNLADYLIPVNADIQDLEVILVPETDDFVNPAGVKGLGELGNVGTAAAVANALYHATGIRFRQLPIRIENLFV